MTNKSGPFLVLPTVQIGTKPGRGRSLCIVWHAHDRSVQFTVEWRATVASAWNSSAEIRWNRLAAPGLTPRRIYSAVLKDLPPGTFQYRILRDATETYVGSCLAPPGPDDLTSTFVVVGDIGAGTDASRRIAHQVYLADPDYVVVPGDIVYSWGRLAEYEEHLFPVFNADEAAADIGAPLLRSRVIAAGLGQHDIGFGDLDCATDGNAYFYHWHQPLNGPDLPDNTLHLRGRPEQLLAFREAAGPRFPRMANYSFDMGGVHWLVLDSGEHVDFADPKLLDWIREDLEGARDSQWRLVSCYLPPFHSTRQYSEVQKSRALAQAFERGLVDLVFSGFTHSFQRSRPLRFRSSGSRAGVKTSYHVLHDGDTVKPPREANESRYLDNPPLIVHIPKGPSDSMVPMSGGRFQTQITAYNTGVDGEIDLDLAYDGTTRLVPHGIIYVVTGAGGANLHGSEQTGLPETWAPFTAALDASQHSFTRIDAEERQITLTQINDAGIVIDRVAIARGSVHRAPRGRMHPPTPGTGSP